MKSKILFKKIDIKNHACYYFDCIMRIIDIKFRDMKIFNLYLISNKSGT